MALTRDSHSSLQQANVTADMIAAITTEEAEVKKTVKDIDDQLHGINARVGYLALAGLDQSETEADRVDYGDAIKQVVSRY